ncbi:uncharacterized protein LOC132738290 [Ruditapes philippinarum]|uniref:uncharacterized protein LOC132738290 n=1 Tax=Ruditapes philippinarum TaxID=129788 RepID=UPI00295A96CE|nr:uncharacterized protein LOC132738290 [Ruditapes philippinarum]
MALLLELMLIFVSVHLCSSFFLVCPKHTQCPNLPTGCLCRESCPRFNFEINCRQANFGSSLPRDTFMGVKSINSGLPIELYLPDNLADINIDAFNGIEAKIQSLNLRNSTFVRIPAAFGKLHNLKALYLSGNHIQTLTYSDFNAFANNLYTLSISLKYMSAYPQFIDTLPVLWQLTLKDIPFEMNDMSIFSGNSVISTLTITYSPTYRGPIIPPSIVNLSGLRSVYFYGSQIPCDCSLKYLQHWDVSKVGIISPCTTGIYEVLEYIKGDLQRC